ncbi:MAG: redoxin domain-containing protein [Gemmatimonadetes bacterium]|nr:redoxin domain-containing protein [Gemmatimonadota bacterium]
MRNQWVLYLLFFSLCPIPLQGQDTAEEAIAKLRSLRMARNHKDGYVEGKKLVERFPDNLHLRAWFIHHMAVENTEEAVAAAEEMVTSPENSAWGWVALASALDRLGKERRDEALLASEKAMEMLPDHADVINTRADVLYGSNKENAITFVDEYKTRVENPARLLVVKGNALYYTSNRGKNTERFEACLKAFAEARQADPGNANGYFRPAYYLYLVGRYDEAYPLYQKAAQLASTDVKVHQWFWRAIERLKNKPIAEKIAEIEADADAFINASGGDAASLLTLYSVYMRLEAKEKAKMVGDRILSSHGESAEAEAVLMDRYDAMRDAAGEEGFQDPEQEETYRNLLRAFIARPRHYDKRSLGYAYLNLFFSIGEDSTISAKEILDVVQGMIKYENANLHITFPMGAIILAERTPYYREAEQIARDGVVAVKERFQRKYFDSEEKYQRTIKGMTGLMADALGWVFFQEGRLEDAERELMRAHELDPKKMETICHLGQVYEAMDNPDQAEVFYKMGIAIPSSGKNPNDQALKSLYLKRHGSLEGYEDYLKPLIASDRETRKQEVLSARIEAPESPLAFNLKTLKGTQVSLSSLKGKVVAINFWGIWCGWCVKEMPEFQNLYEYYKDDPDVAILTINNDRIPESVPPWMEKKGYTFPVLLDDGYVNKAGIQGFPTTWFLNREGQIAFLKRGWTKELEEEFGWRIEALRSVEVK